MYRQLGKQAVGPSDPLLAMEIGLTCLRQVQRTSTSYDGVWGISRSLLIYRRFNKLRHESSPGSPILTAEVLVAKLKLRDVLVVADVLSES